MAAHRSSTAKLTPIYVPEALDYLKVGDAATHNQLIADMALQCRDYDVLLLAQFSMAQALPTIAKATDAVVLTSPETAVLTLKARFMSSSSNDV